jgi:hypothetical protein
MLMILWLFVFGCSATGEEQFQRGLASMRAGDSASALVLFQEALNEGARHPSVYHGLGNALYRMGREAEAAAAWRRGLALAPRDGDMAANLDWVRKGFVDRLEPPPVHREAFFWQTFLSPLETGLAGAIAISIGFWVMVWGRIRRWKNWGPITANMKMMVGGLMALGGLMMLSSVDAVLQRRGAVVTVEELEVRSALGPSGVSLFILHAGAEVTIEEETDSHCLLVLSDGRKGWVNAKALLSTDPQHPFVMTD